MSPQLHEPCELILMFVYSLRVKYNRAGAGLHDFCSLQNRTRFSSTRFNPGLLCSHGIFSTDSGSKHVHSINPRSDELSWVL